MALEVSIKKKLNDFTLDIDLHKEQEHLGILGASGDGKSMTLKCIAGIEKPDSGKIVLNDRVLFDSSKKINLPPQKRKVGYLFQNYALFPNMTVEENIAISLNGTAEQKRAIVAEQIHKFHLEGLEKSYPGSISGGQQQRVALARIMAYRPELIMLDEPFSALDTYLKHMLQEQLLESLSNYEGDVIVVSHSRDEIYHFCEKLVVFVKGNALIIGDTKEIFKNPKKIEAAQLTGCKNISAIQKINENTVYSEAWDVVLHTKETVGDNIRYVGIRAHDFVPVEKMSERNTIQPKLDSMVEMPFELHYRMKNKVHKLSDKEEPIWWYVFKTNKEHKPDETLPKYLYLPPEALMLLE